MQLPDFDFPGVGEQQLFQTLAGTATTAEASGFDSIFVMNHLHQIPTMGPGRTGCSRSTRSSRPSRRGR